MRATIDPPGTAPVQAPETVIPTFGTGNEGLPEGRPVVLALDGSALSERARPWAAAIAMERRVPLVLLAVVDPYQASSLGLAAAAGVSLYETVVPDAVQEVAGYLNAQAGACEREAPGLPVKAYVQVGDAPHQIVEAANQLQASMMVLTTHGRGGVDRWVRGSVAERVVALGNRPVLLIRPWDHGAPQPHPEKPGRRVLVPLDGTAIAEEAIDEAERLAGDGEILLVRDVTPPRGEWELDPSEQLEANHAAENYLEALAERVRADGKRVRTVVLTQPEVAEAIAELVTMEAVDLIALVTHGRGAIGRWLHGSVSDEIARHAPVPVVLVHAAPVAAAH